MATTREALRAQIAELSTKIHEIKKNAFSTAKAEKLCVVTADGVIAQEYSTGCKWATVKYDRIMSHINPKHPDWHAYRHLRREASICLTAMAILKGLGDLTKSPIDADIKSTSKQEALSALRARAKSLSTWADTPNGPAGFRHDNRHAILAWRRLKKLAKKAPSMVIPAKEPVQKEAS